MVYSFIEFYNHQKRIKKIPIRIHVNGTRGKSSVARLIGAGLSAGGIDTITKVTGTYPRLIKTDGSEVKIYRKGGANIIEQLSIIKYASENKVDAIVIECMALQQKLQWITENQMIHATVGVITNVRLDHIDIMGYTLPEIAKSLGETIPENGILFTGEENSGKLLSSLATKKKTELRVADFNSVSQDEMQKFSYIEHRENVALALDICTYHGIERNIALNGMYKVLPDEGALKFYIFKEFHKEIHLYNAFAANDPQSSLMIWDMLRKEKRLQGKKIILLNTRHDRLDRAKQLAEMVGGNIADEIDYLVLIGQSTEVVENMAIKNSVPSEKIVNIGWKEEPIVFEEILALTKNKSTVVTIGNMGGMGDKVVKYFEHRSLING